MAAEEPLEKLRYQTLVLKVPIHCQGCKRSVYKLIRSIEGVYKTTIDSDLHKVTVTGNVEPDILIKKLLKTGKHAEVWPEPKPINNLKKKQNPTNDDSLVKPAAQGKGQTPNDTSKKTTNEIPASTQEKENATPIATPNAGKKKKVKNETTDMDGKKEEAALPMNNLPGAQGYNFPMYPMPTPPAYMMSYNTAQPSYSAAGYFPVQQSNYVYSMQQPYMGEYYNPAMAAMHEDVYGQETADVCGIM